jgi:hypothetical protein
VDDLHRACGALDHRVAEPLPGFVERPTRKRELPHRDGEPERIRWRVTMPGGDTHEIQVGVRDEGTK